MPDPQTTGVILLGRGSSDAGANGELAKMARWLFEDNDHELVDLAFTGVTWPRLETVVQRQARLGMTQICIVPVYLFTGVLMERIKAQVERLRGSTRRSPSRWAPTSASTRASSSCSTPRSPGPSCPKAACSSATAASTARPPRPNTCTTTATPTHHEPPMDGSPRPHAHHRRQRTRINTVASSPRLKSTRTRHDHANTVTEQLTAAGRAIEHDSFAIIDAEVGPHAYSAEQWPLVRRMIHANADFEFNGLTAFPPAGHARRPGCRPARAARRSSPTSR
jgi:hypothetical protein